MQGMHDGGDHAREGVELVGKRGWIRRFNGPRQFYIILTGRA